MTPSNAYEIESCTCNSPTDRCDSCLDLEAREKQADKPDDIMTEVIMLRAKVSLHEKEIAMQRAYFVRLIKGCKDYGGGHTEDKKVIFHHGIQTCINVIEAAVRNLKEGTSDTQIDAVERFGRSLIKEEKAAEECKNCISAGHKIKSYQTSIERYETHCRAQDKWVIELAQENERLRLALAVDKPNVTEITSAEGIVL